MKRGSHQTRNSPGLSTDSARHWRSSRWLHHRARCQRNLKAASLLKLGALGSEGAIGRSTISWLPWAIAACLAVACVLLASDRTRHSLSGAYREPCLTAGERAEGNRRVVWDAEKQEGILNVLDIPPAGSDRDYQLWVVDPQIWATRRRRRVRG
ncbi:MAG: anti-sigma factor [Chthoniobacterales bacterium]|nr:anti-sigma factor [Chthoniobacterales bacterium]